jgi:hypothetical protein
VLRPASSVNCGNTSYGLLNKITVFGWRSLRCLVTCCAESLNAMFSMKFFAWYFQTQSIAAL